MPFGHCEVPQEPKRIPITLSDTHYGHTQEDTHYTKWYLDTEWCRYPEWFFLSLRVLMTLRDLGFLTNKPDTEWYPLHWGIPLTLSYTHYPEFQHYDLPTYDRFCQWIKMQNCHVRQTNGRTNVMNLYIRLKWHSIEVGTSN